jgi:type II secretory pathway pseudopilin PulG
MSHRKQGRATCREAQLSSGTGLTVIELLIAGFVLVVVLGLGGAFLAQQTTLQRSVQARNDVQDRVRVVLQVVAQDFSLVGNSVLSTPAGGLFVENPGLCRNVANPNENRACVSLDTWGSATADATEGNRFSRVTLRYLSSQFAAGEECRDITYEARENGALFRSDVTCEAEPQLIEFATNVEVFTVVLRCSDGITNLSEYSAPGDCGSGYPRTAVITFASRSDIPVRGSGGAALSYRSADGRIREVPCEQGFVCYLQSQEILLPNLKDW